jgi:hypothetical protein
MSAIESEAAEICLDWALEAFAMCAATDWVCRAAPSS